MPRSIELVLQDGESLASALRRFKQKVQQEDIIKEIKANSFYLKPGEKRRTKEALVRKRRVKSGKLPKQGALLDAAIEQVKALSPGRQDAIAETILANLREEMDPSTRRYQELVEAKYTKGLTPAESSEMDRLEAGFRDYEEAFYAPIIERAVARKSAPAPETR